MNELPLLFYFFLASLILFFTATVKVLSLKKANRLLVSQLAATVLSLEQSQHNLEKLQEKHDEIFTFQNSLGIASQSTKSNRPQSKETQGLGRSAIPPERYGYIQNLADKGLSVEEISSILTISTHETRQVVALAKIAQGN